MASETVTPSLHMFRLGRNGTFDWIIARDPNEAMAIWYDQIGEKREDYDGSDFVVMVPDSQPLKIDGEEKQAGEWVAQYVKQGRGVLCSSEYWTWHAKRFLCSTEY